MKFTNDNACSLVVALCCVAAKGPEIVEGGHYRRQKLVPLAREEEEVAKATRVNY